MSGFNMPPGVSPSDIPGNRNEDQEWADFDQVVHDDCFKNKLDANDAYLIWKGGMAAFETFKLMSAQTLLGGKGGT